MCTLLVSVQWLNALMLGTVARDPIIYTTKRVYTYNICAQTLRMTVICSCRHVM